MNSEFFKSNRQRFVNQLDDEIVAVTAYDKMQQTRDGAAQFRQESNFWWLTGINYPSWKFMYDSQTDQEYLVRPNLSQTERVFESWLTDEEAVAISGISNVLSEPEFIRRQKEYGVMGRTALSVVAPSYKEIHCHPNPSLGSLNRQLKRNGLQVEDINPRLAKVRAIKTPEEIGLMQSAIDITNEAYALVKDKLSSLVSENEIEAEFSYEFMRRGARHAYDPIVAFGKQACTLHYTNNNQPLDRGLVLLDIGAAKDGYNADITRTYAVGEPTDFERRLHQAVSSAQVDIVNQLKPGLAVADYQQFVETRMKQALMSLGLMDDENDKYYRQYFPHSVSHGLGVDVHDSLGGATEFQPGMVLTVEPGIYVPEHSAGVRIEDDILITEKGYRNLSAKLPISL